HAGLFTGWLPIAFSCFSHAGIGLVCQRRFDRFAVVQVASQSWAASPTRMMVSGRALSDQHGRSIQVGVTRE
ncbi:hypothetical protein, partial [Pseudomonas chlororaphis]|uniref:hypothetical protein n=1 Tax=Pseudomonas chlororaphis TaxID=587753 RepID=UPI001B319D5B